MMHFFYNLYFVHLVERRILDFFKFIKFYKFLVFILRNNIKGGVALRTLCNLYFLPTGVSRYTREAY